jgi:hypothetical protein
MTMSNSMSEKPAGAVAPACRPAGRRELSAEQRAMFRPGFTPSPISEAPCAGNANLRQIQDGRWVEDKAGRIHALGLSFGIPAHLASTTVEAGFQPASVGRILASSPMATGGRDAALLAGWKPASTVLVVLTRGASASIGFSKDLYFPGVPIKLVA